MMSKFLVGIVLTLLLVLSACDWHVESFEDTIDQVDGQSFLVNCSDQVNRNKHGDIDNIGYLCKVGITEKTEFHDEAGNELGRENFEVGDKVRIILAKPVNISRKHTSFDAAEIIRLEEE